MDIYEDTRTVSRADLAAWLRQLASQLETTGQLFYGAAGTIAVADQVKCELEIEQEDTDEFSVEIEFSWVNPTAVKAGGTKAGETEPAAGADAAKAGEASDAAEDAPAEEAKPGASEAASSAAE